MARPKEFDEDKALQLAVECFWARGYEPTSMRELAERMGIGSSSLYNAYGDKRTLFVKALTHYVDRSSRERIARLEGASRPKEAILSFLAEIIDRSLEDRDRKGCLLVNSALDVAPHDARLGRVIAGHLEEIRAFFRRSIMAAQAEADVPADLEADDVASHLLGVLLGIRVLARARPDRALLEGVARPALRLLDCPSAPTIRRRLPRRRLQ